MVAKFVCLRMRDASQGGSVINISSTSGLNGGHLPGAVAYASSKAALNAMTKVIISQHLMWFSNCFNASFYILHLLSEE